ncbi:hypothetical protein [Streptomyces enissocaesilis]|uniref:Secreted protein n=1 Tax=Streptomyces enissocaesilis TaxID=332589 RepID=A0ABN3WVM5_9ACTN
MGGLRQPRTGRAGRTTRPMVLLSAVATLFAALFVCLSTGAGPGSEPGERHGTTAVGVAVPVAAVAAAPAQDGHAYLCPYDSQPCGAFPHLSPAVLTVPPPAVAVATEPQHVAPRAATDPVRGAGALPRAPGRHVLQVMRT